MAAFKNRNLYLLVVNAMDIASGKAVRNLWWFRPDVSGSALGDPVADSDLSIGITKWKTLYRAQILPLLSANYAVISYDLAQVTGWTAGGPSMPVSNVQTQDIDSVRVEVPSTAGLLPSKPVVIAGMTTNTGLNGVKIVEVVHSPTVFDIPGTLPGGPTVGEGTVTIPSGRRRFTFGDADTQAGTGSDVGGVSEEELPLHATWSIRKITATSGRKYRGGLRISCIPETHVNNGRVVSGTQTSRNAAMSTMLSGMQMVESASETDDFAFNVNVSQTLAFQAATPFGDNSAFAKNITSFINSPNCGSMVRRKPKLSAGITQEA